MAATSKTRKERLQEAAEALNTALMEYYAEGESVRLSMIPHVYKGQRRDDMNLVTIG